MSIIDWNLSNKYSNYFLEGYIFFNYARKAQTPTRVAKLRWSRFYLFSAISRKASKSALKSMKVSYGAALKGSFPTVSTICIYAVSTSPLPAQTTK